MNTLPRNLLAGLLAGLAVTVSAFAGEPKVGDAFPSLTAAKLEGTVPELKDKVVLVDFWASWCGPCKAAFPALKGIADQYKDKGLVVVAVSLDEDKADMDAFVSKLKPSFTILRDPKAKLAEQLDVKGIPSTFILDKSGRIAVIHTGYGGDSTKQEYIAEIEKLLAAK